MLAALGAAGLWIVAGAAAAATPPSAFAKQASAFKRLGIHVDTPEDVRSGHPRWLTREIGDRASTPRSIQTGRRSLGAAIGALRTQPFVNRPAQRDVAERNYLSVGSFIGEYASSELADRAAQLRVRAALGRIASAARRELGVAAQRKIVVEASGKADTFNAVTLANGAIVVNSKVLERADAVAPAIVAAQTPGELVANLRAVAAGTYVAPTGLDPKAVRRQADAFLASVLAHEATHSLRDHPVLGNPSDALARAFETIGDLGGLELAGRARFAVKGQLASMLYQVIERRQTLARDPKTVFSTDHPDPFARYGRMYRYLTARGGAPRWIYDGTRTRRAGAPLLSAAQQSALSGLPSPEALQQLLAASP